jgi:hypothetical protein
MTDTKSLEATSLEHKKFQLEYLRDHWDQHIKNINYLLIAHSATLVGCLSTLKDYNATPQLKGIGVLILISCIGLISAAIAHGLISYSRSIQQNEIVHSTALGSADEVVNPSLIAMLLSLICFLSSLVIVAYRFSFL